MRHVGAMCKIVLATSCMVALAYGIEFFTALYTGNVFEHFAFVNRALGPLAWGFWVMVLCNVFVPQLLWSGRVRSSVAAVFVISLLVNVGMWFERFIIIVTSLGRDFLPSSWASYSPTLIEIATFAGTFGLFFTLFLLFCRFLPMIAIAEVKGVSGYARNKSESRNPKSETNSKSESRNEDSRSSPFEFRDSDLFRISDFEIRISESGGQP
jgi:molybdopterin-containing oxidoreductase family membrane subunit